MRRKREEKDGHFRQAISNQKNIFRPIDTTQRSLIMQRWHILQHDLLPEFMQEWGALTPCLEKLVHIVDWVSMEE